MPETDQDPSTPEAEDPRRKGLLGPMVDYYSGRREGDLPWESGDAFLLGQLGRFVIILAVTSGILYFLSPVAITGTGDLLRVGTSLENTVVYVLLALAFVGLLILNADYLRRFRSILTHSMVLQTDVPWKEMVVETGRRLKEIGVRTKRRRFPPGGLVRGYEFPVRADYAPVKVVGSALGYVTWGGARSLLVIPLPLFRHARWGQDLDHLVRDVLSWDRQERVRTPVTPSLDED